MLRIGRGLLGFGGSWRSGLVSAGIFTLVAVSCGKDEKDPPSGDGPGGPNRGGSGNLGGTAGSSGAVAGEGGEATGGTSGSGGRVNEPLAPTVRITSPEHLDEPDDGAVLVEPEVAVFCEATQSPERGSLPVDASTVVLQMLDDEGEVLDTKPASATENDDEYTASFVLTMLPNGPVSFRCLASDTSDPAFVGADTNQSFVDHGPSIEVIAPEADSAHSLLGAVQFQFAVEPAPLVDDDPGAAIDEVTLEVLDVAIELAEDDGVYSASVDLNDTRIFPSAASSVPVVIRARNSRAPKRGASTVSYAFVLDSRGPEIDVTSPAYAAVVGGEVALRFTVDDELTDVDPATVSVKVNSSAPVYFGTTGRFTRAGNEFTFRFDTTAIDGLTAQATINIDAKDLAGNAGPSAAHLLYLDNQPAIVDLDPPYVREIATGPTPDQCSVAFDPVGDRAANDLATVQRSQNFRAIVWSQTNGVPGQNVVFHSRTDDNSVFLYIIDRPSASRYLLEDTNADGVCDEIKDLNTISKLDLHPIPVGGNAWFGSAEDEPGFDAMDPRPDAPPKPESCVYRGQAAPATLCNDRSDMSRAIAHVMDGKPPVIYAIGMPLGGANAGCSGVDWEIAQVAREGWVCVAARALDAAGNVGVSRPLRLCYDDGVGAPPDCPDPPPSCVSPACTELPPKFFGNYIYEP